MLDNLSAQFQKIAQDKSTRVVVLASTGTVFSAGHDSQRIGSTSPGCQTADANSTSVFSQNVARHAVHRQLASAVIACVQGVATAAGCQLVATCDLAVAASNSRFATPGVDIGLFCSTPMVALGRNVSPKHAMEMLLTGDLISAEHAHRIGLVNKIVESGKEWKPVSRWRKKSPKNPGGRSGPVRKPFMSRRRCRLARHTTMLPRSWWTTC